MARMATGIDPGLRTAKVLSGFYKGRTFHAKQFAIVRNEGKAVTDGWSLLEGALKLQNARVGLSGRDVNIRYVRVPRVPDWQLRNLMRFEVAEIGDQSGSGVASDFNLLPELPEIEGEDIVLLAMARENLLEEHLSGLRGLGGRLDAFTPNAIALYTAWLRYGVVQEDTVMIANIGHDNVDVIICRGPDLIFARNLSGGGRIFTDAIVQRFGVSETKAEDIKIEMATLQPNASYASPNHEKASRAILSAAGQLLSLLQSTVLFCKSQVKISTLRLDRVMLCGGASALDGLTDYLTSGLSVPVELFDPFQVVDTSALDPESAAELEDYRLESVVALGLATTASDPEAYSVEILPARLRKAREFWGGTAFLVAAAVLMVLFLGYEAWSTRSRLGEVSAQASQVGRQLKKAKTTDRKAGELITQNRELSEIASLLHGVAGNGEQVARVIDALEESLPAEFWLSELESEWTMDTELGVERNYERPIVRLKGAARQGTRSLSTSFESLVAALRGLPGVRLNPKLSPTGTEFSIDLTSLVPSVAEADDAPAGDGEEEDS